MPILAAAMSTPSVTSPLSGLQERLPGLMLRDQHRLRRRIDGLRRRIDRQAAIAEVAAAIDAAEARLATRQAAVPEISYPEALPITARRQEILDAIRDHQVVIVAGETGSGKSTQLPKMCIELGRGVRGLIGHTQPRRLAARTIAERIAEELRSTATVGYKMRFTDRVGERALVKVMTDGILLNELQHDRLLYEYDTLIIDEAHERSLNIDFILGYLKQLLPRRPDLKVIVTSATIDPERFSQHFRDLGSGSDKLSRDLGSGSDKLSRGAPIIEVSGRMYPVEVRYRPIEETDDQTDGICSAVTELSAEGPGDILVFLSGEREIRDTADALGRMDLRNTEVLPLYARLSSAEQHRVFAPHAGRRIVLATNVAETSLTVPGIKYVVDPGTARISRYSRRTKVQRLPIEPVSQASANQRKGRCGRLSDGICIRLYSEADFLARPEFTDPEVLRTNLASVILQMTALGLGDIAAFPFVEPPDRRNIADGIRLLHELGALDEREKLTGMGRRLARLPLDPRLARMVIEAERNGCAHEVMVIVAALSIQDPRERPADHQQAADAKHARFAGESDFLSYLNLWRYLEEQQEELSSNRFRRMCRDEYLNYLRVREWQDVYGQLRQIAAPDPAPPVEDEAKPIHLSLLAGLLSHIGTFDPEKREYSGTREARFAIFPGSVLFKRNPRWVMAAELVETSRLWARIVARIEPEWAERLAGHLVKRQYSEPHWDRARGAVMAYEKVTLYGLTLVARRRVNFAQVDPRVARELFIRHALVEGEWDTDHAFFHDNQRLLKEAEDLERRARRRDIVVDDEAIFDFYDARIPADVVSARHFDSWWKRLRQPELLRFERSMLVRREAAGEDEFPDVWPGTGLRLTYEFEPGTPDDGVTVHIPLPVLGRLSPGEFSWQVPGFREELVVAWLRSLPKPLRRNFVPVPDWAHDALSGTTPADGPLLDVLARRLRELSGVVVPPSAWDPSRVADHLRLTFRVVDEQGATLGQGKDLDALKVRLKARLQSALAAAVDGLEQHGRREWSIGTLPRSVTQEVGGHPLTGYPALVDEGDAVGVRVYPTEIEQRLAMRAGTRRLLRLTVPSPVKLVNARLSNQAKLALSRNPHRSAADLMEDCVGCAIDDLVDDHGGPAWDAAGFERLRDYVRTHLVPTVEGIVGQVRQILALGYDVEQRLRTATGPAVDDLRRQLATLLYRGFVTDTGAGALPELPRYLQAMLRRLDKLPGNPGRDYEHMRAVHEVEEAYRELLAEVGRPLPEIRWMIEELRVSYFAQALGTAYPVSDKRIYRAMDDVV
jgi:ATP-dependent helicase HrpA